MHLVVQVLTAGALFAKGVGVEEDDWATVSVAFGTGSLLNHSSGRSWNGSLAKGIALISSAVHSFGAVFAIGIGADADALAVAAMTWARLRGGSHIISLPGIRCAVLSGPAATSGVGGIGFSTLFMVSSAAMTCARLRNP
jgi:hypothetical protein